MLELLRRGQDLTKLLAQLLYLTSSLAILELTSAISDRLGIGYDADPSLEPGHVIEWATRVCHVSRAAFSQSVQASEPTLQIGRLLIQLRRTLCAPLCRVERPVGMRTLATQPDVRHGQRCCAGRPSDVL